MIPLRAIILAICLAMPAQAQDDPPAEDGLFALLEQMLRGFITEVEPQLRDLQDGLTDLEPEMQRFLERMRDMTQFHPPEVLPNGDILIRRRQPDEEDDDPPPEPAPDPFEL